MLGYSCIKLPLLFIIEKFMKLDFLNWLLIHVRSYFKSYSLISSLLFVLNLLFTTLVFYIMSSESSFAYDELFCDLFISFYLRFFVGWLTTFYILLFCFIFSKKTQEVIDLKISLLKNSYFIVSQKFIIN